MEPTPQPASPTPSTPVNANITPRRLLSRRGRVLGAVVAVLALVGTGWLAWELTHPDKSTANSAAAPGAGGAGKPGGGPPGGGRAVPTATVGVARAERANIPLTLEALGTVTPQATVKVRPQVTGVLDKVLFKEGQMVRAGDPLATIDARQFQLALQQATGQRQQVQAQLDSARVTLARFNTLLSQDSIARQEVDTQAALVKQLEGTVIVNQAAEGTARLNLSYTRITAPISGRVGLRTVDVGNVVSTGDANGVVTITQLSPIDVVFSIPQDRAGELQQGLMASSVNRAAMTVSVLDKTRAVVLDAGTFASIDNQVDTATGTVRAKAQFPNTGGALFPNQFVNVQLLVNTLQNAVVVPVTAMRFRGGEGSAGNYVYVVDLATRTVALRPVKGGPATADKVVITEGLRVGESVITEGADRLKDGASVTLPGDAPRGPRRGASGAAGSASAASGAGGTNGERSGGWRRQRLDGASSGPGMSSSASPPLPAPAASANAGS
ncbi:MAG: efflux RND transporter periplasmic adaptor subunit [Ferruginibacter sp.]|nr:efflux RND transporter periplasmic adaptor subunit [Rhodoferax sp.]